MLFRRGGPSTGQPLLSLSGSRWSSGFSRFFSCNRRLKLFRLGRLGPPVEWEGTPAARRTCLGGGTQRNSRYPLPSQFGDLRGQCRPSVGVGRPGGGGFRSWKKSSLRRNGEKLVARWILRRAIEKIRSRRIGSLFVSSVPNGLLLGEALNGSRVKTNRTVDILMPAFSLGTAAGESASRQSG